jgi:hypothetical protein
VIELREDLLLIQGPEGGFLPCSADDVAIQFVGEAAGGIETDVIRNAARAVLEYFRVELGLSHVAVEDFTRALLKVLRGFGYLVSGVKDEAPLYVESDLCRIAAAGGAGFELGFFASLRGELRLCLEREPQGIRFCGLRRCVKQLTGARRWTDRCQELNDRIVDYLRACLGTERREAPCSMVVVD